MASVRGTVLDIDMEGVVLPLSTALQCRLSADRWVTAVIQAHVSPTRVRAIALQSTRGLRRGAEVRSDGEPLSIPVGPRLLGRVVDLLGTPSTAGRPWAKESADPYDDRPLLPVLAALGPRCTRPGSR